MTFDEFVNEYYKNLYTTPEREGQYLMNLLHKYKPELYNKITNTRFDCFYADVIVPNTLEHISQSW